MNCFDCSDFVTRKITLSQHFQMIKDLWIIIIII